MRAVARTEGSAFIVIDERDDSGQREKKCKRCLANKARASKVGEAMIRCCNVDMAGSAISSTWETYSIYQLVLTIPLS